MVDSSNESNLTDTIRGVSSPVEAFEETTNMEVGNDLDNEEQRPIPDEEEPAPSGSQSFTGNTSTVNINNTASTTKCESNQTEKNKNSRENDTDGMICLICQDVWDTVGDHRIVSLRCGHLYGEKCIRHWVEVSNNKTCPQCNRVVEPNDIRYLYAKCVRALDRSQELNLKNKLEQEYKRGQLLRSELTMITTNYNLERTKNRSLMEENEHLKSMVAQGTSTGMVNQYGPRFKLALQHSTELGCFSRSSIMDFSLQEMKLIVSQRSNNTLFPGYGLRFLDMVAFRPGNYIHASIKPIRDISVRNELIAVTYIDTTMKVFDIRSGTPAMHIAPVGKDLWSCHLGTSARPYNLYLGGSEGTVFTCDLRMGNDALQMYPAEDDTTPVFSVQPLPCSDQFIHGGFVVGKLLSLSYYEYNSKMELGVNNTRLDVDGPFISLRYCRYGNTLLAASRNSAQYGHSRLIYGKIIKANDTPIYDIHNTFMHSTKSPKFSRASQITTQSADMVVSYAQDSKQLVLYDTKRGIQSQSLPIPELVCDTCPIYFPNGHIYLSALSDSKVRLYKVIPVN